MTNPAPRVDEKVPVKVVLSGLWISMMLVFAYVDIFGFWRADVIRGALDKRVPGVDVAIDQTFLVLTTAYVLVPSLMVVVCLVTPVRVNRPVNLVASALYAISVVVSTIGETWAYYLVGSAVEVLLLVAIAAVAWSWPRSGERTSLTGGRTSTGPG